MDIANKNKEYHSKAHLIYSCQYHVIFCPKYRRRILKDGIDTRLKEIFNEVALKYDFSKRGVKLTWVRSNNYIKTLFKLKNLYRLKANYIKLEHNKLVNKVLSLGNEIYVESMNFSALQKRSKETTINKKGKFNRKGRFGKSLGNKAPAMLLTIIDRKLGYIDKSLNKINTTTFKASQYNHIEDTYIKKKLNQRWNKIEGELVQRDLYSAFLIMNSKQNLKETDRDLCLKTYESFKEKHDKLIKDLKANQEEKYLSSFGIKKTA